MRTSTSCRSATSTALACSGRSPRTVLSASYVGTQNRHQNDYEEIDLPERSLLPCLVASNADYNEDVPYLGYHSIRLAQDEANGHYNSLQASLNGQITKT